MNVLVLKPLQQKLDYYYFADGWNQPVCSGKLDDYRGGGNLQTPVSRMLQKLEETKPAASAPIKPEAIAIRGICGGSEFTKPTVVNARVIKKLEKLVGQAPLHTPALLGLIQECQSRFPHVPIVLVFETAFFVELPAREHLYAINPELAKSPDLRRFGYHGILHEAVCHQVSRKRKAMGVESPARLVSICLEPRPEVAAILGQRPVMVTSGSTPLEGLPGQTSCGELDPSIVLMMAQVKGMGPEQINAVLTQQSGWCGLVGEKVSLDSLFKSDAPNYLLARQVFQYRILQACGAAMAAMGGLDVIAFCGRYASVGVNLSEWLTPRLTFKRDMKTNPVSFEFCSEPIERVIAETAMAAVLSSKNDKASSPRSAGVKRVPVNA